MCELYEQLLPTKLYTKEKTQTSPAAKSSAGFVGR